MALIQTNPKRRRYGVAALAGVLGGIVSAIVKFGWEVPLPLAWSGFVDRVF